MVPTNKTLPPERINTILNTFFGLLADDPETADDFIKDRADWLTFNRLALKAAKKNPAILLWILEMGGAGDMLRWLGSYKSFTLDALKNLLFSGWFSGFLKSQEGWLSKKNSKLWFKLLVFDANLSKTKKG